MLTGTNGFVIIAVIATVLCIGMIAANIILRRR